MQPKMKLVKHNDERVEYPLDAEVIHLGREQARTIPIRDPLVSRRHAEITCVSEAGGGDAWFIRDLGSTNGTYINDTLLTTSYRLRVGDRIRLGNTLFTYEEMESGQRFRNIIAILIALSTLVGALIAWRASVATDDAADARGNGTSVLIRLGRYQSGISASLYQNLGAFVSYRLHLGEMEMLDKALADAEDATHTSSLESERLRHANMALAALDLVDQDYLRRAESAAEQQFDRARFTETNLAEAATLEDLDYESHFRESDRAALIAQRLTITAVLISLSIFFYTGATLSESRRKYLLAVMGVVLFGLGTLAAALVELAERAA